jgi:rubrerythrin
LSDYKVITTYVNPTGKPGKQFTINDLNLYTIFKKVDNEEVERDMQKEITQILKNRNEEEAEKLINYLTRQVMLDQGDRQVTYKFVDPNKALKNRENLVKEMEELYYQMFGMYPPGSENKEEQPPEETKKTVNIGDTSGFTKYLPAIIAGGILLILIIKAG